MEFDAYDYMYGDNAHKHRAVMRVGSVFFRKNKTAAGQSDLRTIQSIDWARKLVHFTDGSECYFENLYRDNSPYFDEHTALPVRDETVVGAPDPNAMKDPNTSVDKLGFMTRTLNILDRLNITTVGKLWKSGMLAIAKETGCGPKVVDDIRRGLLEFDDTIDLKDFCER